MLIQIDAPHFCAGAVLDERGRVTICAPIIKYFKWRTLSDIQNYCAIRRWKLTVIE